MNLSLTVLALLGIEEKAADPDQFFGLCRSINRDLFIRVQPIVDEYTLCTLKINQLNKKGGSEEEIVLLENIRKEDERRLFEMLYATDNSGI